MEILSINGIRIELIERITELQDYCNAYTEALKEENMNPTLETSRKMRECLDCFNKAETAFNVWYASKTNQSLPDHFNSAECEYKSSSMLAMLSQMREAINMDAVHETLDDLLSGAWFDED